MESESTINTEKPNISTAWNEANIINSALDAAEISRDEASNIVYEQLMPRILHTKMFVELPRERLESMNKTQGEALRDLLNEKYNEEDTVLDILAKNNVSLAIAMQEGFDTDPLMLSTLKNLNAKGIKPTLWLVLDDTLGYWTNKTNVEESLEKLNKMVLWSKENRIDIEKIGLDYEPPIELLKGIMNLNIPQTIKETYKYISRTIKNRKKFGNLQNYIDENLQRIRQEHGIEIETYAAMEPLRSLSNWLSFRPNQESKIVSMAYTSASNILERINEKEIPALGIVGSDPFNTPGKDLRENRKGKRKPEKHLTLDELTYNFNKILGRNNPFRTHYVFALDSAETLNMVLDARNKALLEK
jgi:hypothetical protein